MLVSMTSSEPGVMMPELGRTVVHEEGVAGYCAREATVFLPFDQGSGGAGHTGTAGNPPVTTGYQTAYLWEPGWQRDAWRDIVAFVQPVAGESPSEDDIREHARAVMPKYMIPKHIRFVEALPVTPTNKVEKYKLKQQIVQELGW